MNRFGRPALPTVGETPGEQRQRAGLRELVSLLLDSGALLTRNLPGKLLRGSTLLPAALQWGAMNRTESPGDVVANMPKITPKQIGVPLGFIKSSPTGIVTLRPVGSAADGSVPTLDGSATGIQVTTPGLYEFETDGLHWYSSLPVGGAGPVSVTVASGVFPPESTWKLPPTYSPIALWQFNESLADSSSVGQPAFSVNRGTVRYTEIAPGVKSLLVGGATGLILRLPHTGVASMLRLTGDMSVEFIWQQTSVTLTDVAGSSPLLGYRGRSATVTGSANDNSLWGVFQGVEGIQDWFTESGAGVGFSHNTAPTPVLPPPAVRTVLFGARRQSDVIQFFLDGKPMGSPSTGVTPAGGSSGVFWLGGQPAANESAAPQMIVSSLKVCNHALSDADFLADYNATLGQYYGTRY